MGSSKHFKQLGEILTYSSLCFLLSQLLYLSLSSSLHHWHIIIFQIRFSVFIYGHQIFPWVDWVHLDSHFYLWFQKKFFMMRKYNHTYFYVVMHSPNPENRWNNLILWKYVLCSDIYDFSEQCHSYKAITISIPSGLVIDITKDKTKQKLSISSK